MVAQLPRLERGKRFFNATPLARPFWIGLAVLVATVAVTAHPQNFESGVGGVLILVAGCIPFALWVMKQLGGLPVFPVFAMTHVWAFGFPLLYEHPVVVRFPPGAQFFAAASVVGFLLIGTVVWYWVRHRKPRPPRRCFTVDSRLAETFFIGFLVIATLYTVFLNAGWLSFLPGEVFSIVRSVMLALEALSCFVLSYRLGTRELKTGQAWIFKILFCALIVAGLPTLFLITPISLIAVAGLGYISASGRIPWLSLAASVVAISFLHAGKADMREQFWGQDQEQITEPWDYPIFFGKWVASSVEALFGNIPDEDEKPYSIVERTSLMQLLLFEQESSPDSVPFLYGDTYVILPELLIPRIIRPSKPTSHEGTYRLNIHYGFQTREQTESTTIGFGLLNESFANFGLMGMAALAIILGAFYGYVEGLALSVPLLSLRGLFVVLVAAYAFQIEFAAGVWLTALFQSTMALLGLTVLLMKVKSLYRPQVVRPPALRSHPVQQHA